MKLLHSLKVEEEELLVRHKERRSFYHGKRMKGWQGSEFWRRRGWDAPMDFWTDGLLEESIIVEIRIHLDLDNI